MKYLKKFEIFIAKFEGAEPGVAEPEVTPDTKPDTDAPTKPQRPKSPVKPITRPNVNPDPKAHKENKITSLNVANRFINEINKRGESVKKYLNK